MTEISTSQARRIMRLVKEIAEYEWSNGACDDTFHFSIHVAEQTALSRECAEEIRDILGLPPARFVTSRHKDQRYLSQPEREYVREAVERARAKRRKRNAAAARLERNQADIGGALSEEAWDMYPGDFM